MNIDENIHIELYNPIWSKYYHIEKDKLQVVLSVLDWKAYIEHFGSTAIPGMDAKPIIDILIGVNEIPNRTVLSHLFEHEGYEYLGEAGIPGRHAFRKRGTLIIILRWFYSIAIYGRTISYYGIILLKTQMKPKTICV